MQNLSKYFCLTLSLFVFLPLYAEDNEATNAVSELSVMSFNIRTSLANDPAPLNWEGRRNQVIDVLISSRADFIGLQELSERQREDLSRMLVDQSTPEQALVYAWVGNAPILYNTKALAIKSSGAVELIEDKWEPRFMYWVIARDISSGKEMLLATTHWGVDAESQWGSAKIIAHALPELSGNWSLPVVLLGDFNIQETSEIYKWFNDNTPMTNQFFGNTYTGFGNTATEQLDYVWGNKVVQSECVSNDFGKYEVKASDHFAVACGLKF